MNILSVDAAFGGATHDSFIFNRHPVKNYLSTLGRSGGTSYLLGDSGYPQRQYLRTLILNAEAGSPKEFYSTKHCSARNVVERTIGLLNARWRCLLRHRVLYYDPDTAARIINACCVLHNLCNKNNCPQPLTEVLNDDDDIDVAVTGEPTLLFQSNDELQRGQEARQRLVHSI